MSALIPDGYAATLDDLKRQVHAARFVAQRKVNTELLLLWWHIGNTILERQKQEAWGSGVLKRLADDLRAEVPSMKGFSRANLFYMRGFAAAWPDRAPHGSTLAKPQHPLTSRRPLVAGKNDAVVRYALASTAQPVAVSRYELAEEAQAALPDEATIVEAFSRELARGADAD